MTVRQKLTNAIDTVARHVVRSAVFDGITGGKIDWSDYPELGEHDWQAVSFRALQLADGIDMDRVTYSEAYEFLEKRAAGEPV